MGISGQNWAGNLTYQARSVVAPQSVEEVQSIVAGSERVHALGSRHSFTDIADTPGTLVSTERLAKILEIDRARRTVTIEGGVRYGELGVHLGREGLALHNLASLPHITVAGAVATATHGSGEGNGNLATAVAAFDVVTGTGEVLSLARARDGERFAAAVVSLGALGIVTRLTLNVEPHFDVAQTLFEALPFREALAHFDEIQAIGYSVSLFTDWSGDSIAQVWLKQRMDHTYPELGERLFGARRADADRHPIPGISAESCTAQMGRRGAWHDRLPHFRLDFTPSSGEELQSEYFVARSDAAPAMEAIRSLGGEIAPLLLVSEIRTIAADDLWMSPCRERDSVAFHFTWRQRHQDVMRVLAKLARALEPFAARPHLGKLFAGDAPLDYPKRAEFAALATSLDPQGKLRNAFLERTLFR